MLILACDSSGPAVSAAIWKNDRLLAEKLLQAGRPHSATLMPLIGELLRDCALQARDMDAFACAEGPGSFTGIRIGICSVKAMAYAAGRPAIGISTLEAMAWPYSACARLLVCPILDARNQRVYASAWLDGQEVIREANWQAAEFLSAIGSLYGSLCGSLCGSGKDRETFREILVTGFWPDSLNSPEVSAQLPGIHLAPRCADLPRSAAVAELASLRLAAGLHPAAGTEVSQQSLRPRYLALTQAERSRAELDRPKSHE